MTKKPKLRGGIVGSGFAANLHYEGMRRVHGTDVDIVGIFSPTSSNARRFAEPRGLRTLPSLGALLDEVDVVHVCASPSAHEAVAVAALGRGVHAVVEKPLTGWFGDGAVDFHAARVSMKRALDGALASIDRMLEAEAKSNAMILYAENWVYAPAIQKEREIIEKTGAQVLWIHGEESHSGSHSKAYGFWRLNGGGALIGKGVHPLTAALYLKRVEGRARNGRPIRPVAVSARTHAITRLGGFVDRGFLRTDYHDVEDFSATHVVFEDGTVADIFASEIVMGGIHNWLEVMANNHRTVCNINPNTAMQTYNPAEDQFRDIYVVEKIGTKQGWAPTAPDEDFITGFPQEVEAFYRAAASNERPEADSRLAADCISTVYSAYLSAELKGAEVPVRAF
jgi:predicted dehydrogenase